MDSTTDTAPAGRAPVTTGSLVDAMQVSDGTATLDRSWWSWAGPHGGFVAGLCVRASLPLLGEGRVPRSLHAVFLEPAAEGELALDAAVVREGGSSIVVSVTAGDAVRATVVAGRPRGDAVVPAEPLPDVPGPEECDETPLPADVVPFSQHLRFRFATAARPFASGPEAQLVAWARLVDDVPLDHAALVMLVDAMPPAAYAVAATPVAVPTVDLTVSFTDAPPASGWVLLRITTRSAAGGWCLDDSEVWDADGRLLARGRQTRRVLGEWA
ncbi:thioesterase family protein [Nocardioides korecus]